ncbi:MAG: hypothetical protein IJ711_00355 [Lachnospiraceae bacterium]|nr:hypothetical protein [Clostridia bacterium]MBR1691207.1 hypothetical protein [Lachnospiraceae bacterium]
MLEIKVTVEAAELSAAINNLASALGGAKTAMTPKPVVGTPAPQQPMQVQPQQPMATPAMPVTQQPATAPVAAAPAPAPTPMPTAGAPQYTVDQIMQAGATLMDAGKVNELTALLAQFGVQAVMDLKPEQMGAFATEMRKLGAKI